MTTNPPAAVPLEYYVELAADQRRTIHNSVSKLRSAAKERLDVRRNLSAHFWPVAGAVSLVGLVLGYNLTGIFTDR